MKVPMDWAASSVPPRAPGRVLLPLVLPRVHFADYRSYRLACLMDCGANGASAVASDLMCRCCAICLISRIAGQACSGDRNGEVQPLTARPSSALKNRRHTCR